MKCCCPSISTGYSSTAGSLLGEEQQRTIGIELLICARIRMKSADGSTCFSLSLGLLPGSITLSLNALACPDRQARHAQRANCAPTRTTRFFFVFTSPASLVLSLHLRCRWPRRRASFIFNSLCEIDLYVQAARPNGCFIAASV
jgi:hypothetical protein